MIKKVNGYHKHYNDQELNTDQDIYKQSMIELNNYS